MSLTVTRVSHADRPSWRLPLELDASADLARLALSGLALTLDPSADPPPQEDAAALTAWLHEPAVNRAPLQRAEAAMLTGELALGDPSHRQLLAEALETERFDAQGRWARPIPGLDSFMPPLLIAAFRATSFRRASLALIRRHLETRVFLYPDGPPLIPLAVPTCLLLAAFVARSPPPLVASLERAARIGIGKQGWAGFWDQWLTGLARSVPGARLPDALDDLPLLKLGIAALSEEAEGDDPRCAPGWRRTVPAWVKALLMGTP